MSRRIVRQTDEGAVYEMLLKLWEYIGRVHTKMPPDERERFAFEIAIAISDLPTKRLLTLSALAKATALGRMELSTSSWR